VVLNLTLDLKKLVSLLLLAMLLFNTGGYYVMFWALRYQADTELQQQLDANDYPESEAFLIEIPITLPYQMNSNDFERLTGEFEHNGEFYQLIKQKLENDTLKIVCIKNHKEKHLVASMADFTKVSNDLPASTSSLKVLGNFLKEYHSTGDIKMISVNGWSTTLSFASPSFSVLSLVVPIESPPPQLFS
jgi:hypothetical protein